jgi:putative hydrolase of the HAD superfamily
VVRAVLFDLDDTLYPELDFVRSAMAAVADAIAARAGVTATSARAALDHALHAHGRGQTIDLALDALGIERSQALIAELVGVYRGHAPRLSLHVDAARALVRLSSRGLLLGLVTDGDPAVQRAKAKALALERWMRHLRFTWDDGPSRQKPHPAAYRGALDALGVAGHEAAYVGDNPIKDFVGARALGLQTIRLRRGPFRDLPATPGCEPAIEIESHDDLDDALARVTGTRKLLDRG